MIRLATNQVPQILGQYKTQQLASWLGASPETQQLPARRCVALHTVDSFAPLQSCGLSFATVDCLNSPGLPETLTFDSDSLQIWLDSRFLDQDLIRSTFCFMIRLFHTSIRSESDPSDQSRISSDQNRIASVIRLSSRILFI